MNQEQEVEVEKVVGVFIDAYLLAPLDASDTDSEKDDVEEKEEEEGEEEEMQQLVGEGNPSPCAPYTPKPQGSLPQCILKGLPHCQGRQGGGKTETSQDRDAMSSQGEMQVIGEFIMVDQVMIPGTWSLVTAQSPFLDDP